MKRITFSLSIIALSLSLIANVAIAGEFAETLWEQEGFEQPESVYFDKLSQKIFVSNISGGPSEANGKGYISLLSADGTFINKKWITGMDAPKGMAVLENNLFVSDLDKVHVIDIQQGTIMQTYTVPAAKFLNDVAASDDGKIYISDMMDHAIYEVDQSGIHLWMKTSRLSHPNGVLVEGDDLLVGAWGTGLRSDFTTQKGGSLLRINRKKQTIQEIKGSSSMGNLDGVIRIGTDLITNDWINGKVFAVSDGGERRVLGTFRPGLADISSSDDVVYMPYMMDGKVQAVRWKN